MDPVVCHGEGPCQGWGIPLLHSWACWLLMADSTHSSGADGHCEGAKAWLFFQNLGSLIRFIPAQEFPMLLVEVSVVTTMLFIFSLAQFCFPYILTEDSPTNLLHSHLRDSGSVSKITHLRQYLCKFFSTPPNPRPNRTSRKDSTTVYLLLYASNILHSEGVSVRFS